MGETVSTDHGGQPGVERVVVLGAGLIGTSIALALRSHEVDVVLSDPDPATLRMAVDLGAGRPLQDGALPVPADVAVVAAPPGAVPEVLRQAQDRGLAQVYTDAASVKAGIVADAERLGCDMATYVPGHPMGGREKNGPGAARSDLFLGRSWALCPTGKADPSAIAAVSRIARLCGADPRVLDASLHDRAVALVSHAPHMAASAVAAQLTGGDESALALAGQGVRDVTRVAGGDPGMWTTILSHNAAPVARVLRAIAEDLAVTARSLEEAQDPDGSLEPLREVLERGRTGQGHLPGKHGAVQRPSYAVLPVVVSDEPGVLGHLFAAAGEAGVNIEDVRIEHTPGLPMGTVSLSVLPEAEDTLVHALSEAGWSVHPGR
ncbi:prephenate dehydrogenase [Nocardiopsis kunsanensis]|uniref:Prephenate dehydrogenase n=1 Tax=Nocardiopsis kunsanensis TaxID=141693 RepID=A0A919CEU9_9ACTN|nr:prephenate dehydrogenase [Nocardiopsis kunsanensis]